MKLAFVVYTDYYQEQAMKLLADSGIDYYTRWSEVAGKGRGTEPHFGRGMFGATNGVLMIGFEKEEPLEMLVAAITAANAEIKRPDDRIRLFQVPLERIV